MQTFEETVRKRSLVALATIIGLALLIGLFWANQNDCDLVGHVERHDCDLGKLNNQ